MFILRAVGMEVLVRRAVDVNPLMVRLTKNQGTNVPRSPQFCPREVQSALSAKLLQPAKPAGDVESIRVANPHPA